MKKAIILVRITRHAKILMSVKVESTTASTRVSTCLDPSTAYVQTDSYLLMRRMTALILTSVFIAVMTVSKIAQIPLVDSNVAVEKDMNFTLDHVVEILMSAVWVY